MHNSGKNIVLNDKMLGSINIINVINKSAVVITTTPRLDFS